MDARKNVFELPLLWVVLLAVDQAGYNYGYEGRVWSNASMTSRTILEARLNAKNKCNKESNFGYLIFVRIHIDPGHDLGRSQVHPT